MNIAIASDHGGFELKQQLIEHFAAKGQILEDLGTCSTDSCDYPDIAKKMAKNILNHQNELGILICGTGIGISMAANKVKGIRAACCSDYFSAKYTRLHNDANVLCLGARVIGAGAALELVDVFLNTEFEGGRHQRRVDLITAIENE